ncbi:MAG: serine hydrolase domain-containing protein [Thermohalobaculum sp.]
MRHGLLRLLGLALLLALPARAAPEALTPADAGAWLDGLLPQALEAADIPGAAVSIVTRDGPLVSRFYGKADVAAGRPVGADTLFRPGSVSKLFTWIAVMQLVERGRLDLDADVQTYLDFPLPPHAGPPITLRHLMTHRAGFEERAWQPASEPEKPPPPLRQIVRTHIPRRGFEAGSITAYSNYGASLAGYVVERASGEEFADYVDRHIFQPLGMTASSFRQPLPGALLARLARGYVAGGDTPVPFEVVADAPAGALSASTADLARFLQALLREGEGANGRILKAGTLHAMEATPSVPGRPVDSMRLGFMNFPLAGLTAVGHGGDLETHHTLLAYFPTASVGVVIAMNSEGRDGGASRIRAELAYRFALRYLPVPPPLTCHPPFGAPNAAELAGQYTSSRTGIGNFLAIIRLADEFSVRATAAGDLQFVPSEDRRGRARVFCPVAPGLWHEKAGDGRIAISPDPVSGRWLMHPAGAPVDLLPVPVWRSRALLLPAVSIAALLSATYLLAWPARLLLRRRLRDRRMTPARLHLPTRLRTAALTASVLTAAGWVVLFVMISADHTLLGPTVDPLLLALQGASCLVFPALFATAAWHALAAWRAGASTGTRIVSFMLLGASGALLLGAKAAELMVITTRY